MTSANTIHAIPISAEQREATYAMAAHYASLLGQYGDSARALDWGSSISQELRFAILAGIADLSGATILDVGCGLADFHAWLLRAGIQHQYTGIDLTPEMAARAATRFPETTILSGDFADSQHFAPQSFDVVVASGIFAFCQHEPLRYLQAIVEKMFHLCRKGVAFNSLSAWRTHKEPGEFHPDPAAVMTQCASLTSDLVLRHDYHPGDFTIYIYRSGVTLR